MNNSIFIKNFMNPWNDKSLIITNTILSKLLCDFKIISSLSDDTVDIILSYDKDNVWKNNFELLYNFNNIHFNYINY